MIAAGWSARGYWDQSALWHEPNGDGTWSMWEPDEDERHMRFVDSEPYEDDEKSKRVTDLFYSF